MLFSYSHNTNMIFLKVIDAGLLANISESNATAIIYAGIGINAMAEQNQMCRKSNIIQIGCDVVGVCGFVFNDFLDTFEVLDGDGEIQTVVCIPAQILINLTPNNHTNLLIFYSFLISFLLMIRRDHHDAGQLTVRAGQGLHRVMIHAGDLAKDLFHAVQNF